MAGSCAAGSDTPAAPTSPVQPLPALCHSSLSVDRTTFESDGGTTTGRVVSSHSLCGWTITTPSWITASPASGTGPGIVTFTIRASTEGSRTGDITLGTERVAISQSAWNRLFHNARCHGPASIGMSNVGICTAFVRLEALNPHGVTADLRMFGLSETYRLVYVAASSGLYDLDLRVPAGFPPGVVTITFTARDSQGNPGTITAPLEVRQP